MAQVTTAGLVPTGIDGYVEQFNAVMLKAFGGRLNLAAHTPQGRLVRAQAAYMVEQEEALLYHGSGAVSSLAVTAATMLRGIGVTGV